MAITTKDFPNLVQNADVQFRNARKEYPTVRQQLAQIVTVNEETSEHSHLSSVETARRRGEGENAYVGDLKQGFNKQFSQTEIDLQMNVTKRMRKFDKWSEIMQRMRNLAKSAERREEIDLASLLSYAWSTSYTSIEGETINVSAPDGKSLIDNSHGVNQTDDTYSNEIDSTHDPISTSVLERLEEQFNGFLDTADGRQVPVTPDTIITGNHAPTKHVVRRILNSEQLAGTANNDKNSFKGDYQHLVVPFLDLDASTEKRDSSKKQYCFLAALNDQDVRGFRMEESQGIQMDSPEQVFENKIWQFGTSALYDFGILFPNFIVGTKGDGSAV